jgi:hypothetical protein
MNTSYVRALLGALSLGVSAASVAAAPQYVLTDLGSTTVAGAGLVWQIQQYQLAPPNWPSSGGTQCTGGTSTSYIWAQYPLSNIEVGATCEPTKGQQAAKWVVNGGSATLTDLGRLPGALTDANGPFSVAYDFNNVGDIVGQSQSSSPSYSAECPSCVALHGFVYNSGTWTDLVPIAGPGYESIANSVNDSREIVGWTNTVASTTGEVLNRAFVYIGGTMYNLTFYLVGGPTVLLQNAYWIDCEGDIAAIGTPAAGGTTHSYLLVRQGTPRTNCPQ